MQDDLHSYIIRLSKTMYNNISLVHLYEIKDVDIRDQK